MALTVHTGNKIENLVAALAGILSRPLGHPLTPEMLVVQNKGMQRWLSMELAKSLGIWANCNYPFPNEMLRELFATVLPDTPAVDLFSKDVMRWRLMEILPCYLHREEFSPLSAYLSSDDTSLKLFQLAGKIADTFDQYTLFRPEMLLLWEQQRGGDWQQILWRDIAAAGGGRHRARLKDEFCRFMQLPAAAATALPERITVFGISYLPKYHLDVLAAAALRTEVHIFTLSPTDQYWGDIVTRRERRRLSPEDDELFAADNQLLASLGRLGRDYAEMLLDVSAGDIAQHDYYAAPGDASLLATLKSDIMSLGSGGNEGRLVPDPDDHSLQVHSCHSPLREIEVLYDNILHLFEQLPDLTPRDILVMTPDLETYAPYIAPVFAGDKSGGGRVPYAIAGRSMAAEGRVTAAFLKILALAGSRLTVPQVLDILEMEPVFTCFGFASHDLTLIRGWLKDTRVCWGVDAADRVSHGLPAYGENSWSSGIDRLMLGYAMSQEGDSLFNRILPYDRMEGSSPAALGRLAAFMDRLFRLLAALPEAATLSEWQQLFSGVLSGFIMTDDDSADEYARVAAVIAKLADLAALSGFSAAVSRAAVSAWISAELANESSGLGYLGGGLTFCDMLPMRSIPFRVVMLVGMNDGAFPRQSRPPGFDLISQQPRRGDRSLRDEDRYLFLEAILSARDCLYISYVGQSIKDNSPIPPCVLVSELLDAIDSAWDAPDEKSVADKLISRHRLQAFSPDYFTPGSGLFSYSAENCAALRARGAGAPEPTEFIVTPLAAPPDEWREVTIANLLRFFDNPARFLLEKRLGIRFEEAAVPLEEREPFSLDSLEAYGLKQELLEILLHAGDAAPYRAALSSRGVLPPAAHGELLFTTAEKEVALFVDKVKSKIAESSSLPPLDINLEVGAFRLIGRLDRIWPERMLRYRCARVKGKDRLRTWLEHLLLNAVRGGDYPVETALIMTDCALTYQEVLNPLALLESLLALYWEGLTVPLRFFPASSLEYAKKQEWSLERARAKWADGYNTSGEGADPCYQRCFGTTDPFNADFERISRQLLEPLLLHEQKDKG